MNTKISTVGALLGVYLLLQVFLSVANPLTNILGIAIGVYFLSSKNRKEILPITFSNPLYEQLLVYAFIVSNSILLVMSLLQKKDDEKEE